MKVTRIIAAVVDKQQLTMYREDGSTIIIQQGDQRIRPLVDKLIPALEGPNKFCDLNEEDFQINTHYAEAEKKMGGVVRFFRVLKAKAKEILDKFVEPVEPMTIIGSLPVTTSTVQPAVQDVEEGVVPETLHDDLPDEEKAPQTRSQAAVAEIMAHSAPASSPAFHMEDKVGAEHETTVVAVLADNTVIPGVEKLNVQVAAIAANMGSPDGMNNFFTRVGSVKRAHTVQDLLKFMEKGELPVADDGCVLAYKRLQRVVGEPGVFVDCHSERVRQRVGSRVFMAEAMVDPNRSRDCSNGLHVARRDYLSGFSGDVCVLIKLAPEDVIAVPTYDAKKLRAKGYHIVAELSQQDHDNVVRNRPLQDTALLGNVMSGNHIAITELVEITGAKGTGVKITVLDGSVPTEIVDNGRRGESLDNLPQLSEEAATVDAAKVALRPSTALHEDIPTVQLDDLRAEPARRVFVDEGKPGSDYTAVTTMKGNVVKSVELIQAPPAGMNVTGPSLGQAIAPPKPLSGLALLKANWKIAVTAEAKFAAVSALFIYKRSVRKSWSGMGFSIVEVEQLTKDYGLEAAAASLPKEVPPNDDYLLKKSTEKLATKVKKVVAPKPPVVKTKDKPTPKVKAVTTPTAAPKRTQQEEAAHLWGLYQKNPDLTNCRQLVAFKKQSKKSWTVLGLTDEIGKRLTDRLK